MKVLKDLCQELLSYLPDSERYSESVWEECTSEEQEQIKKIRSRANTVLNLVEQQAHDLANICGYQPKGAVEVEPKAPKGGIGQSHTPPPPPTPPPMRHITEDFGFGDDFRVIGTTICKAIRTTKAFFRRKS